MGADFSPLGHVDELHCDFLVPDLQPVHFLHSQTCLLGVLILNECETLAHTSLRISVDVHVLDFSEGLEKFFEFGLLHF
jgi:hypothetical protein